MNTKNLEYLNKQLFYTGFGHELAEDLQKKIASGQPNFDLQYKANYGRDEADITLHFKKSAKSDLYFFNQYEYQLKPGHQPGQELKQTFYIGRENNITAKEAYNLMSGRAIYKQWTRIAQVGQGASHRYQATNQKYGAWLQMDFSQKDENGNFKAIRYFDSYNFDLEKALAAYPIKALQHPEEKKQLLESLQKGNRQKVTSEGPQQVLYIEANPRYKNLTVYDEHMKKLTYQQDHKVAMVNEPGQQLRGMSKEKSLKGQPEDSSTQKRIARWFKRKF